MDTTSSTINPCFTGCFSCSGSTAALCDTPLPGFYKSTVNNTATLSACPNGCITCQAGTGVNNATCITCPTDFGGSVLDKTTNTCNYNCLTGCDKCTV